MRDWKILLTTPGFRSFWLALMSDGMGTWCVIATLPILVAQRFGAGSELVISLGLRIAPRILLAPVAGAMLRRYGATRVAVVSIAATGVLTALLPWCRDFIVLQAVILAVGVTDICVVPALLALRAPVTPRGLELAGNSLFFSADRLAKFAGPALAGLAVTAGLTAAYLGFGAAMLLAAGVILRLPASPPASDDEPQRSAGMLAVPRDFAAMLRNDAVLVALLCCAVPYMVTLGGMRPFLFWANAEWFGASDAAWTVLLAAQGIGGMVGVLLSGMFTRALLRGMSVYELMLVASLLEGLSHVTLLFATGTASAVVLLIAGGIPEMLAYATFFACIQERLRPDRQALFYSMQQPLLDTAFALGVASAGLHAQHVLSLASYWAVLSLFSTLPVVPLLVAHVRSGRMEVQPRV
jgi:predicted MFS family arabinose efflux permease